MLTSLWLTSGRLLVDGRQRDAYVALEFDTDEEGCRLLVSTRTNTGGTTDHRTRGKKEKTVSLNWATVRDRAKEVLAGQQISVPQEYAPNGPNHHFMWRSDFRYVDPDDHEALKVEINAHLDMPAVLRAYEEIVAELLPDEA